MDVERFFIRTQNWLAIGTRTRLSLTLLSFMLVSCDNFNATPVTFTQADIIPVGNVHTLEIQDRVLTSLPSEAPQVDTRVSELGRLLFWDPILSGDRGVACATCHLPESGYTDNQRQAIGVGGVGRGADRTVGHTGHVPRNTQTVLNTVWNGMDSFGSFKPEVAPMFWDNRVLSLESQALEPIRSLVEMRGENFVEVEIEAEIAARLNAIPAYQLAFKDAFGIDTITASEVAMALAGFQRTLIANQSPFDRWMRGEANAMTGRQVSGMQEFVIAGCADCHSGPLFSDFTPRVLGVQEGANVAEPDTGDGTFAFRTPSLRQLAFSAPYFHAGQFSSLGQVIEFYDEPRSSANPNVASSSLDPELLEVPEMEDGRGAIIEDFLNALNDDSFDKLIPESVPSGLPPGGFHSDF